MSHACCPRSDAGAHLGTSTVPSMLVQATVLWSIFGGTDFEVHYCVYCSYDAISQLDIHCCMSSPGGIHAHAKNGAGQKCAQPPFSVVYVLTQAFKLSSARWFHALNHCLKMALPGCLGKLTNIKHVQFAGSQFLKKCGAAWRPVHSLGPRFMMPRYAR